MKVISVKNLSTNEEILKADKVKGAEVVEVEKQIVVFEFQYFPPKSYGNFLFLTELNMKRQNVQFEFIGKLISNELLENIHRVRVNLLQYDKHLWVRFLQRNAEKQDRVDGIIRSIKGDD